MGPQTKRNRELRSKAPREGTTRTIATSNIYLKTTTTPSLGKVVNTGASVLLDDNG